MFWTRLRKRSSPCLLPGAARGARSFRAVAVAAAAASAACGCTGYDAWRLFNNNRNGVANVGDPAARVPYAPPVEAVVSDDPVPDAVRPPLTVRTMDQAQYRDISLEECIRYAMDNSKVIRNLGVVVLRNPESIPTRYLTAVQYADPRFGPEAALAAFDTQFSTRTFFNRNDRVINNRFFGGGTTTFQQDLDVFQTEISKRAATGTTFAVRNNTEYDANNAPANLFPSVWNTNVETEARHPLLQGGGTEFNRIAGPNSTPGVYNGVVIARVNNDIAQADFEISLRDFVSDVSNAYWELYFAYRSLDAAKAARDQAFEVWQRYQAAYGQGGERVSLDRVALAREQYFRFQREVEEALSGRPLLNTGSDPGAAAFRGFGGVLTSERRLRLLLGWPITDECLLRPSSEPQVADVSYDWGHIVGETMSRRTELHRQKLLIKRRQFELTASKNFLSPRLDVTGLYRWRGFGDRLAGQSRVPFNQPGSNALANLTTGDFQEWQVGVEFNAPIGFRVGHAAVQHAELLLARERAVLHEQERRIVHDLSNAIAEKDRAYQAAVTNLERLTSANALLESLLQIERTSGGTDVRGATFVNLDRLLDAQRRVAEGQIEFFRALSAYEISLKNVNYEKGSLLEYSDVLLAGGEESRSNGLVPFSTEAVGAARAHNMPGAMPPAPAAENPFGPADRPFDPNAPTPLMPNARAFPDDAGAPVPIPQAGALDTPGPGDAGPPADGEGAPTDAEPSPFGAETPVGEPSGIAPMSYERRTAPGGRQPW